MPIHVKQGLVGDGSHTAKQDLASDRLIFAQYLTIKYCSLSRACSDLDVQVITRKCTMHTLFKDGSRCLFGRSFFFVFYLVADV
jgi:hypothetical protein